MGLGLVGCRGGWVGVNISVRVGFSAGVKIIYRLVLGGVGAGVHDGWK